MDYHTLCYFFFFFFFFITTLPQSHCEPQRPVYNGPIPCTEQPYKCGNLSNIWYPFWGENRHRYCGGGEPFELNCHNNETTTILISSQNFTVLSINTEDHTMKMKRTDLNIDVCSPPQFQDTYLSPNLFHYSPTVNNITIFYKCSLDDFSDSMCGDQNAVIYYVGVEEELLKQFPPLKRCKRHIQVPVGYHFDDDKGVINRRNLDYGLDQGFEVKYIVDDECVKCLGTDLEHCRWDLSNATDFDQHIDSCSYLYCEDGFITSASDKHSCSAHKKSRV